MYFQYNLKIKSIMDKFNDYEYTKINTANAHNPSVF
jgi:hypothetical protein